MEEGGDKCIIPPTTAFARCIKQAHCDSPLHYCDLSDSTAFTYQQCVTLKSDTSACAANYECSSTYCISSVCAASAAADGGACDEDADCAAGVSWCASNVCKARVVSGGSCTPASDKCVSGDESCLANDNSGSNNACSVLHGVGEYCGSNSDCEAALYCNGSSQCETRRTDYATCSGSDLCDEANYNCESLSSASKCIAPLTSGSCTSDTTCQTGYFCSTTNQCTAYLTEGSCAGADQRCWHTHFCSSLNTCISKYSKDVGEIADNPL